MNSIDEIVRWHPKVLQIWLREIEQTDLKDDLILAMSDLPKGVSHLILENLSSKLRKMILNAMKEQDKFLPKSIEKAKKRILDLANTLIDMGELSEPDEIHELVELKSTMKLPESLSVDTTKNIIGTLMLLNRYVHERGLLSLEEALGKISDPFLQEGLQFIMDGTDPDLVEEILRNRLQALLHQKELLCNLMIEGILGIQQGNSNWTLNIKLRSHLPPEVDDKE